MHLRKSVERCKLLILILINSLSANLTLAQPLDPGANDNCPVSMDLRFEEKNALMMFNAKLSHARDHFGKETFQKKLNDIIMQEQPEKKVIEISPAFMEQSLNLVDQYYLKDSIATTIGLDHPLWKKFERGISAVTFQGMGIPIHRPLFARETEKLMNAIKEIKSNKMRYQSGDEQTQQILKARAITRLANMYIYLQRWDIINGELIKMRASLAAKKFVVASISIGAGALLVASLAYAGPIVAGASAFGGSLVADAVVATQLARLGQVVAGVGMGAVGAPTVLLLKDSTFVLLEAQRASNNNGTTNACEIDKLIKEWKSRGVSPYLNASLVGGGMGLGGGLLTLSKYGAQVVLYATSFGVGIAEAYTIGQMSDANMESLAEYRMAQEAMKNGDRKSAIEHLHNSRAFAQEANEKMLEAIIVGALAVSLAREFPEALIHGEKSIRTMYANSSDTLPQAVQITVEATKKMIGKK